MYFLTDRDLYKAACLRKIFFRYEKSNTWTVAGSDNRKTNSGGIKVRRYQRSFFDRCSFSCLPRLLWIFKQIPSHPLPLEIKQRLFAYLLLFFISIVFLFFLSLSLSLFIALTLAWQCTQRHGRFGFTSHKLKSFSFFPSFSFSFSSPSFLLVWFKSIWFRHFPLALLSPSVFFCACK